MGWAGGETRLGSRALASINGVGPVLTAMKRAPGSGRPTASQKPRARAGRTAWVRSAPFESSAQVLIPLEGYAIWGNRAIA